MKNLTNIEKVANELNNDLEKVKSELRRVQSIKCRLKKQKGKSSYEEEMRNVLEEEQILKEVRALLEPKDKFVTTFSKEDVERLDYDETIKALKSIQSKKTLTRWLNDREGDNDEFRNACKIEGWLKDHRDNIKPIEDSVVRKSELVTIIDTIKDNKDLSQERIIELLERLL